MVMVLGSNWDPEVYHMARGLYSRGCHRRNQRIICTSRREYSKKKGSLFSRKAERAAKTERRKK